MSRIGNLISRVRQLLGRNKAPSRTAPPPARKEAATPPTKADQQSAAPAVNPKLKAIDAKVQKAAEQSKKAGVELESVQQRPTSSGAPKPASTGSSDNYSPSLPPRNAPGRGRAKGRSR